MLPVAADAEPRFVLQWNPVDAFHGQDEWTPAHALRQSLEGCILSGPFPSLADTEILHNLLVEPYKIEDGHIHLNNKPGLGFELDEEKLEKLG